MCSILLSFSLSFSGLLIVLAGRPGLAVTLSTRDGLQLTLSGRGRVTDLRLGATTLPMPGDGGFALADFNDQPKPANLIANAGFETGKTGWSFGNGQSLDTAVVHSGKAAARLVVPGPAPASSNMGVVVPVKPNTRYRAGLWLRRRNVGVCGAYLSERDDRNKLAGPRTQIGANIPKRDGVWLPVTWDFTTGPATTRLSIRADIYRSTGILWVDDFFLYEYSEGVYTPVPGVVTKRGDTAEFNGSLAGCGLDLHATLKQTVECLRVDGEVRDSTGRDRAVGVRFALPLDLAGWTWFTDAEERETIEPGRNYRYTYRCISGVGECSIYPWSAVTTANAGLTLALPLSQGPRVFLLQHDQRARETSITFFFGLTKDAGRHPSRAPFSFVLYTADPRWGMRSAMERYYRLFPESFVKRPPFEGYLNYANLERFDPATHRLVLKGNRALDDASDFGEGYKFLYHVHGCYDFRMVPSSDPNRPRDAVVFSLLRKMVEQEHTKRRGYVPTVETLKKIVFGPQGQIRYLGDTRYWRAHEGYNHTDRPGWGLNFRVNEDPDVSAYVATVSRHKAEEYAKNPNRRPWDAMFTADAIEGYMCNRASLDYRREHFETTLVPLTFGKDNLLPAMPNTIWDFHAKCWWPLTNKYRIVTYGNSNSYEQAFTLPFVDVPMTEGNWDPRHDGRLDRYLRGMAYHKIWRYWHAWNRAGGYGDTDPENVYRHFRRGLAYAVYPAVYSLETATYDLERYRAWFRRYVPAIEELSSAGWEPIPYAHAAGGVIVERYGNFAKGELHFTLRNYSDGPVKTTLSLDRPALGIGAEATLIACDILPRTPRFVAVPKHGLQVVVEADGTKALWIGTREQAARHGFRLALALLGKLDRMFATELTPASRTAEANAGQLARQGTRASIDRAVRLAETWQGSLTVLQQRFSTHSPVDLAKLIFRMRVAASYAPVAVLGVTLDGPRVFGNRPRGGATAGTWRLRQQGQARLEELAGRVISPWPEVAAKCSVNVRPNSPATGGTAAVTARLFLPPDPPRRLMPFLLLVTGKTGGQPFSVALPVDLIAGSPVTVSARPERAFRGEDRQVELTIRNHLSTPAELDLKFSAPPNVTVTPAALSCEAPPQRTTRKTLTLTLARSVPIGTLQVGYTVESDDARFHTHGVLRFLVGDPVPQVTVHRTRTPPVIDGRLTDSAWQTPPLIPELRLSTHGGPATEKTVVWATYDDAGLYVAFRCHESQMDKLVAKHVNRGAPLYLDDDVEVLVLPPGGRQVLQFAVNALGTRSDNFGNENGWKAAARRGKAEWTVEMFLPFRVFGGEGSPAGGLPWGMQFGRQEKAKKETTSWTPGRAFISKESFGEVSFR